MPLRTSSASNQGEIAIRASRAAYGLGIRTFMVFLNGQARPVDAQDRSLEREKADANQPGGHAAVPMSGAVTMAVEEGK